MIEVTTCVGTLTRVGHQTHLNMKCQCYIEF